MRLGKLAVGLLLFSLMGCGGGSEETVAPVSDPNTARMTTTGEVVGYADGHDTYAWKGIPYAAPPVGELRWRAPQPPLAWEGARDAVAFGPACTQFYGLLSGMPGKQGEIVGSEDCLTLNIWAPRERSGPNRAPLPVMVWIHGGSNTSGSSRTYFGETLAGTQDVVVITINYRLGLFGWFTHPAFRNTAANPLDASGNFGTLDTIAALQWVQKNIAQFGGDPANVTVFGESAGGRNVYALVASPKAKGLFHKAISQSGSIATNPVSFAENYQDDDSRGMQNSSREIVARLLQSEGRATDREAAKKQLSEMSDDALISWLRSVSAADLYVGGIGKTALGGYSAPQTIQDGVVLSDGPMRAQFNNASSYNAVPLMTGTNRDENKIFLAQNPEYVSRFLGVFVSAKDPDLFNRVASHRSDHWKARAVDTPANLISSNGGAPVFAYRWDWDEGAKNIFVDYAELIGAGHGMEISFVFGEFDRSFVPGFFDGIDIAARDKLSDAMMSYWTQFAYTGDPGKGRAGDLPTWGAWGSGEEKLIVLDTDADGGIRMTSDGVTIRSVQARLVADDQLPPQKRCELYAQMFFLSEGIKDYWDQEEYISLGCADLDPWDVL